jgi:trehalose 6-phosphate synthase
VQDYHLALVAPRLRARRDDVAIVHFSHTPFASPDLYRVLPTEARRELLDGMAASDACGFHTARWADAFRACCTTFASGEPPPTFVAPLAPDAEDIGGVAHSDRCDEAHAKLDERLAGRHLIVRVDRIELSKNLLRGFHAFDDLLERYPTWRERVVFGAFVYPSREGLTEYLAYRQEVEGLARFVNEKWATADWEPIILDASDDFPASVAALRRFDVLLVNPIRDGLNLVAKEGPMVNERDGALVLSSEAGVWDELADVAVGVHPLDIAETADALADVLGWDASRRADHATALRAAAMLRTPRDWLGDLIRAASS